MKLYYYTYETTVFRSFFDTEYDLYEGFLINTPLGLIRIEDGIVHEDLYSDLESLVKVINQFQPRNFDIVELK